MKVRLSRQLHARLKSRAALCGLTMQDIIGRALRRPWSGVVPTGKGADATPRSSTPVEVHGAQWNMSTPAHVRAALIEALDATEPCCRAAALELEPCEAYEVKGADTC